MKNLLILTTLLLSLGMSAQGKGIFKDVQITKLKGADQLGTDSKGNIVAKQSKGIVKGQSILIPRNTYVKYELPSYSSIYGVEMNNNTDLFKVSLTNDDTKLIGVLQNVLSSSTIYLEPSRYSVVYFFSPYEDLVVTPIINK